MTIEDLRYLFDPSSIAVIGASRRRGSVGNILTKNLIEAGFDGPVFPVNPAAKSIHSLLTYPSIKDLPFPPDLAVICTPPEAIPELVDQLGAMGTKAAIIITAGFSEMGDDGRKRQEQIAAAAKPHGLRLIGPNCVGVLSPGYSLNASFAHRPALTGDIALASQSGAIITAILDWASPRGIGFSHMVSVGGMADVDFADLLDYFAQDDQTKSIVLYIEQVTNPSKFMSAARAASRLKPIIVIKPGRHLEAAKAASSHTGALAGSDAVADAAFARAGLLRLTTLEALFDAVEILARHPSIQGPRLAILTNGGGLGVLATDRLLDAGGTLASLGQVTMDKLNDVLPQTWSHANPIDIIGDAPPERYVEAFNAVYDDPDIDAVLILNCPTAIADSSAAAAALIQSMKIINDQTEPAKPVLTCWVGDDVAVAARKLFVENNIPAYEMPGQAIEAFMNLVRYKQNQEFLMEAPPSVVAISDLSRAQARTILQSHDLEKTEWMSEPDAKKLLSAYDIPCVPTENASSVDEAVQLADSFSYPIALKILSPDITHKSDVGGVALGLADGEAVRNAGEDMLDKLKQLKPDARLDGFSVQPMIHRPHATELIAGIALDKTFGPVILFGRGGTAVEVYDDKALTLPPLNLNLCHRLIKQTEIYKLLIGFRNRPAVDLDAVALVLLRLSELAIDFPEIVELDINPLWADHEGVVALDARIRLGNAVESTPPAILPEL